MSAEKLRREAARWLEQASRDLDAAALLAGAGHANLACFHAQQAGEKALKACWYAFDADPRGHSLLKLIQDFPEPEARTRLLAHDDDARHLDRMYIPTRYPSGLPDVIPAEAYTAGDARAALGQCRRLLEAVGSLTAGRI